MPEAGAGPGRRCGARLLRLSRALCVVLALSGCLLMSGPTQSADSTADGGNVYVSFVSAEGSQVRSVATQFPDRELEVIVFAQNERGQLRIDVLDPQGSVVLALNGQPEEQTRTGRVRTDASGVLRYRVQASGAQNGSFSILYQPVEP